jgi:hypothetical protein
MLLSLKYLLVRTLPNREADEDDAVWLLFSQGHGEAVKDLEIVVPLTRTEAVEES